MKKVVSVLIALVMMFSVMYMYAIPAFASEQWEPRPYVQDTLGCVNGEPGDIYSVSSSNEITYSYNGEGTVTDWELPLLKEGEDFEIVSKEANKFTIKKLDDNIAIPYVNAVVDFKQDENASDDKYNSSTANSPLKTDTADKAVLNDTESPDTASSDETLTIKTQDSDKWVSKDVVLICAAVIVAAGALLIIFKTKKSNVY